MKILVVSGFLGAGKTTFIKALSEKTGRDFCIFENEYAQADIDRAILSEDRRLNIWELTENCICCTGKQDFASSVLTIANTLDPEFLVVEPTGIAKLSSILRNLKAVQYERISILSPLVVTDGNLLLGPRNEYQDIFEDQIINAGCIVVTKMENASASELDCLEEKLKVMNPDAELLLTHYSEQKRQWWDSLLEKNQDGIIIRDSGTPETEAPENITLTRISLDNPVQLIAFLEMITFGVFGRICRAKGFLPCGREWLRFDTADRLYSITGIEAQEDSRAVFIGSDICRSGIRRILNPDMQPIMKTALKDRRRNLKLPERYSI